MGQKGPLLGQYEYSRFRRPTAAPFALCRASGVGAQAGDAIAGGNRSASATTRAADCIVRLVGVAGVPVDNRILGVVGAPGELRWVLPAVGRLRPIPNVRPIFLPFTQ